MRQRSSTPRRRALLGSALAPILVMALAPGAARAGLSSPSTVSRPATNVAPLPLNVNGKHVFWADGVRTVALSGSSQANPNNLLNHGGMVQHHPKVYLTFWGTEWQDGFAIQPPSTVSGPSTYTSQQLQTYITAFFSGVGGTPWNNIQTQYCDGVPVGVFDCSSQAAATYVQNPSQVLAGVWTDPSAAPPAIATTGLAENVVPDPVATEAIKASQHFAAANDLDATFFVFTPPGRVATGATPTGAYCGYHTEVTNTSGAGAHGIRYSFIPYILDVDLNPAPHAGSCGMNYVNKGTNTAFGNGIFDGFSIVAGHEFAEAVTDPDNLVYQDGWNDVTTNENGDKCAWIPSGQGAAQNIALNDHQGHVNEFAVQSLWSNAFNGGAGGCVVSYP